MPHSTTKRHRPKRPDHRPNHKERKKALAKKIQTTDKRELMPNTTIPKSLRKEREPTGVLKPFHHSIMNVDGNKNVGGVAPRKKNNSSLSKQETRIRSLQKVMRQIQVLQERQEAGESLDDAQIEKINRLDDVIEELEELLGVADDNNSDDDDYEEDESDGDSTSNVKTRQLKRSRVKE